MQRGRQALGLEASSSWSNLQRIADEALWNAAAARPLASRVAIRFVRIVVVTALAFQDRMLNLHAMGLVYATLLSLVPLLAVTFSVLNAFGAQYRLEPLLARMLEPLGPQAADVTQRVVDFVSHMNIGVLGALGVAGLFYTVVSLIGKVEAALNDIWNVRRSRGLPRKFSDYLSVLLVGPVLVFAAFAIIASLRSSWLVQRLLQITRMEAVTVFVAGRVVPLLLLAAAFTFLYRFLPYTRVRLSAAVIGALAAAVLWQLSGTVFTALVAGSTTYAAIYSTFAVLILSLIWLQVAWLVVLIGAQVAYVHQHPSSYAAARRRHGVRVRDGIGLVALVEIARRHQAGLAAYTVDDLAAVTGAPLTILEELVDDFVARGILARAVEPPGLILARPADQLLVVDLLDAIRNPGGSDVRAQGTSAKAVLGVLRRQDEILRDALQGMTLSSLASEIPAAEATVAELAQYRRS
jgi:membrane protein